MNKERKGRGCDHKTRRCGHPVYACLAEISSLATDPFRMRSCLVQIKNQGVVCKQPRGSQMRVNLCDQPCHDLVQFCVVLTHLAQTGDHALNSFK